MEKLSAKLTALGYERNYQVENEGQFSIRGGIVDVFPLTEENPIRIELWGDEIDSIRSFDILSQRSLEKISSFILLPAAEAILTEAETKRGIEKVRKEAQKREAKLFFHGSHQLADTGWRITHYLSGCCETAFVRGSYKCLAFQNIHVC